MKIQSFLIIVFTTLVSWWFILPTVNNLKLPLNETYGIISHAVNSGRNPSTNIAIYLILLLLPSIIIVTFILFKDKYRRLRFPWFHLNLDKILSDKNKITQIGIILIITIWNLNYLVSMLSGTSAFSHDAFHFGEKIGLTTAYFGSPRDFFSRNYTLIHGFGLNVVPGLVGRVLGGENFDVATTSAFVYMQSLLAVALSFFILYEVSIFISVRRRWEILLNLSLIYFAFNGILIWLIDRDLVFVGQSYLLLRWLRSQKIVDKNLNSKQHSQLLSYPFWISSTIPFSIVYVYDRALYFIFLYVCVLAFFLFTRPRIQFLKILAMSLSGLISASLTISIFFGFEILSNSISDINYWSKVSGLFTGLPYPNIAISVNSLIAWSPILIQSLTLTLLCLLFRIQCLVYGKKVSVFLIENDLPILLFVCSILYMRIALGRSDSGHIISPGFFAIFAFIALLGNNFDKQKIGRFSFVSLTLIVLTLTSLFNMNSVFISIDFINLINYASKFRVSAAQMTNSDLLDPVHQMVSRQLKEQLKSQSCFYTLTSEGLWYRLLDKSPCSRYWYLIYAATTEAQNQVVQDLESSKPNIILYAGGFGDILDGIPKEASHLLVHQYVWKNYRPYQEIGNRWFWIRRDKPVSLDELLVLNSNSPVGFIDDVSQSVSEESLFVARGWVAVPNLNSAASSDNNQEDIKTFVLLTANSVEKPDKFIPLNVVRATQERTDVGKVLKTKDSFVGWSASNSQLNLEGGRFEVRAWRYSSKNYKFYPIDSVRSLEVKK